MHSNMMELDTPIEEILHIGFAYQKKLKKLGIKTVQDLLFYFPSRYDDFSDIIPIRNAKVGFTACVQGRIISVEHTKSWKKRIDIIETVIEDETGAIKALWFNQPYLAKSLREDDFVCLAGKVSLGKDGIYLNNPVHEKIPDTQNPSPNFTHTGRIVPIYPETKGLTSRWLRHVIKPLLEAFIREISETLPKETLETYRFLGRQEALWQIHFPDSFASADAAKARFTFEDLFLLQLTMMKERALLAQNQAPTCPMDTELMQKFTKSLPFLLTDSQKKCSFQILKDIEKPVPMSRLLEGDVGSGKTVVAAMAALNAVKCGWQVAFMAPTEILAIQHFKSITRLLEGFLVKVSLITGKEARVWGLEGSQPREIKKKDALEKLGKGEIDIIIGTHSLIQKGITFMRLALVVLDEQHRFGVAQRAALTKHRKLIPHFLSMTATPIPRTLALTIYGDLDLSLISEMPKDRKAVKTLIVEPRDRKAAYDFIAKEAQKGKGIFVICPKIESNEGKLKTMGGKGHTYGSFTVQNYRFDIGLPEIKAVKEEYEKLANEVFPNLRVTMLHGRMKPKEKEKIMFDFNNGEVDILVSTSVVEVGVDVPRATVMMIEGAERFGLAQLHQFRGRVGRSDMQSYCLLFTTSPDQLNRKRLKAMVDSHNGFDLAQKDLEIRGPGQLYGSQQWGIPDVAMEGLSNLFLVEKTRTAAKSLLEKDPALRNHPLLAERIKQYKKNIHLE